MKGYEQPLLLHHECTLLYKTKKKQQIIDEVTYKLSNIKQNSKKNNLYEKLLNFIGCNI